MNEETETKPRPRKKTQVVIPEEGIEARITENIGGKRVTYVADVVETPEDETENNSETESSNSEIDFENLDFQVEVEPVSIPQTPLEKMFGILRHSIATRQTEDGFIASVMRLSDAIGSKFNVPCTMATDLGTFQFRSTDMFKFASAIQGLAGNSGGFFNIRIYKLDQTPLKIKRNMYDFDLRGQPPEIEVGLLNYSVTNPPAQIETVTNNSQHDPVLLQRMEQTEKVLERIMDRLSTPPAKNPIEDLLMQKALDMVMNPPERKGFNMEETMASVMQSTVMMSSLGEALAKVINREPPAPPERNGVDLFKEVAEIPLVQQALSSVFRVSEQYAAKHLTGKTVTTADDEEYYDENENEMNELTKTLIAELESPNPLDENNETIQALQSDYPEQVKMLRTTCKTLPFDTTVVMLINLTAEMKPSPFAPFINIEETQKTGIYIFNERGMALKVRLEEFYNFVKAQN